MVITFTIVHKMPRYLLIYYKTSFVSSIEKSKFDIHTWLLIIKVHMNEWVNKFSIIF